MDHPRHLAHPARHIDALRICDRHTVSGVPLLDLARCRLLRDLRHDSDAEERELRLRVTPRPTLPTSPHGLRTPAADGPSRCSGAESSLWWPASCDDVAPRCTAPAAQPQGAVGSTTPAQWSALRRAWSRTTHPSDRSRMPVEPVAGTLDPPPASVGACRRSRAAVLPTSATGPALHRPDCALRQPKDLFDGPLDRQPRVGAGRSVGAQEWPGSADGCSMSNEPSHQLGRTSIGIRCRG